MKSMPDNDARSARFHTVFRRPAALPATVPQRRLRVAPLARLCVLLTALLLASGCQRTLLSHPPADSDGCDTALHGYWVSVGDDIDQDGEVEATLSPDCIVSVIEHRKDGPRVWPPVRIASARIAGRDLLWLDAATTNVAFEIEPEAIDRDATFYVFAYQIKGDRLTMLPPNHRDLARQVVDGKLDGAVLAEGHNIVVRLDGTAEELATLLGKRTSFQRKESLRFRRGDATGKP